MASTPTGRCIAVIYGTRGGMGDVGKFAAAQASKMAGVTTRVVAMYAESRDSADITMDADVTDEALKTQLKADFESITIVPVNVEAESAQADLEAALDGVEAVVACLASRQPLHPRWLASGAKKVTAAMAKKNVSRLVNLSSMGVGDDPMPRSMIRVFFDCLLALPFRKVMKDLTEMEEVVEKSGLDYLHVRPVALTPSEPPIGSWKLLKAKGDGALSYSIAKADVAAYMLQEALTPTMHKAGVTIGQPKK